MIPQKIYWFRVSQLFFSNSYYCTIAKFLGSRLAVLCSRRHCETDWRRWAQWDLTREERFATNRAWELEERKRWVRKPSCRKDFMDAIVKAAGCRCGGSAEQTRMDSALRLQMPDKNSIIWRLRSTHCRCYSARRPILSFADRPP